MECNPASRGSEHLGGTFHSQWHLMMPVLLFCKEKKILVVNFREAVPLRENSSFNFGDNQVLSLLDLSRVSYSLDQRSKLAAPGLLDPE